MYIWYLFANIGNRRILPILPVDLLKAKLFLLEILLLEPVLKRQPIVFPVKHPRLGFQLVLRVGAKLLDVDRLGKMPNRVI